MREDETERSARNVLPGDTVQGFAAIYTKYRTTRDVSTVGERLLCVVMIVILETFYRSRNLKLES